MLDDFDCLFFLGPPSAIAAATWDLDIAFAIICFVVFRLCVYVCDSLKVMRLGLN